MNVGVRNEKVNLPKRKNGDEREFRVRWRFVGGSDMFRSFVPRKRSLAVVAYEIEIVLATHCY